MTDEREESLYPEPLKALRKKESPSEVAARIEARYDLYRQGLDDADRRLSILALVAARQAELVDAFFRWWDRFRMEGEEWKDALPRFEEGIFGAELYPAARGVLGFAIRRKIVPDPNVKRSLEPHKKQQQPQLSPEQRQRRFDEALGRMAREKSMGDVDAEKRKREEQVEKLRQQIASMRREEATA